MPSSLLAAQAQNRGRSSPANPHGMHALYSAETSAGSEAACKGWSSLGLRARNAQLQDMAPTAAGPHAANHYILNLLHYPYHTYLAVGHATQVVQAGHLARLDDVLEREVDPALLRQALVALVRAPRDVLRAVDPVEVLRAARS